MVYLYKDDSPVRAVAAIKRRVVYTEWAMVPPCYGRVGVVHVGHMGR